jgi:hypothetical protein
MFPERALDFTSFRKPQLLELLRKQASESSVPAIFMPAFTKVSRQFGMDNIERLSIEAFLACQSNIACKLFERNFDSDPQLDSYALNYGQCMANGRILVDVEHQERAIGERYERMIKPVLINGWEDVAGELGTIRGLRDQVAENAAFFVRVLLGQHAAACEERVYSGHKPRLSRTEHLAAMAQVRTYIESYYSDPKKIERLHLLAQ